MSPPPSTSSQGGGRKTLQQFGLDLLMGGTSAAIAKTSCAPLERTKLLLQVQYSQPHLAQEHKYKGIVDCLVRVPREQGVMAYWRGNFTNVARYFPTQALNFAFKDEFRRVFLAGVPPDNFWRYFAGSLAAGGAAGATSLCFVYPLDFAMTRLAADVGKSKGSREFHGLVDCLTKIRNHDGIKGMYRGFTVSLQGIIIYRAAYFGFYDTMKAELMKNPEQMNFFVAWALGMFVSMSAEICAYPWDTIRRRLMMQSGRHRDGHEYTGTWDAVKSIVRNEGIVALYRGSLANAVRAIGSGLVLALYDEFHKYVKVKE